LERLGQENRSIPAARHFSRTPSITWAVDGDDRMAPSAVRLARPQAPGGFVAVHLRHFDIEQDGIERFPVRRFPNPPAR